MFSSLGRIPISVDQMSAEAAEMAVWNNIVPVGREFGSADYERLEELDTIAFEAMGNMLKARRWLNKPNKELQGLTPEKVANSPEGLKRVREVLAQRRKKQV
jgi:hypothetical protein